MKHVCTLTLMAGFLATASAWAAGPLSAKELQQDVARHKAMAAAHEAAAKCLESGKAHDICHKEMQVTCKGLAVGKFCGMKHQH